MKSSAEYSGVKYTDSVVVTGVAVLEVVVVVMLVMLVMLVSGV